MLNADHCFRKGEMFTLMESIVTIYTDRKKKPHHSWKKLKIYLVPSSDPLNKTLFLSIFTLNKMKARNKGWQFLKFL